MTTTRMIDARTHNQSLEQFLALERGAKNDERDVAREVIDQIRARGFDALADNTRRFDQFELTTENLAITTEEMDAARQRIAPDLLEALELAARRIESYHRMTRPEGGTQEERGITLSWRWNALDAVGLYVPGGRARYPSSLLMNAIPARVAGVERIVMVTPTPQGRIDDVILAAASIAGVSEAYRIGGAQAVAALAYGAGPICPVDKVVGPGNAYVTAAKREVFGDIGIDTIAGPSEIVILADDSADPVVLAADLLAQSEHDPAAQAVLITPSSELAETIRAEVEQDLAGMVDQSPARASWPDYGAIILVEDIPAGIEIVNRLAPEHVELILEDHAPWLPKLRHAGAIFIGAHTAEALGDYVTGSNHVLPTSRAARFSSGLSTTDFMKRTSIQHVTEAGLRAIGPAAVRIAEEEGLEAHALSVQRRLDRL
jgi:histidinol dehydrogenase